MCIVDYFLSDEAAEDVNLTTHLHLVLRLEMLGYVMPLHIRLHGALLN
jgi:hypothetical protein